jgi:hypothetical protein
VDPVIFENSKIAEVLAEISKLQFNSFLRNWEANSAFDQRVLDDRYPEYPNKSSRLSLHMRQTQNWKLLFQRAAVKYTIINLFSFYA